MKLALHRSIIFWSGLFVIGFLGWGWGDSQHTITQARVGPLAVGHNHSYLYLSSDPPRASVALARHPNSVGSATAQIPELWPAPFIARGKGESVIPISSGRQTFRATQTTWAKLKPTSYWCLYLPHWLILLAVTLAWLALLVWRARRRNPIVVTP